MRKAVEIMKLQLDPADKNFPKLLAVQSTITSGILSLTARVDNAQLRGVRTDRIEELLLEVRGEDGVEPSEEIDPASLF